MPLRVHAQAGPTVNVASAETLILRIYVNTQDKGDLFVQRAGTEFLVRSADLGTLGIRAAGGIVREIDGAPHVALNSITGLQVEFDQKDLALRLSAEPALLQSSAINLRAESRLRGRPHKGASAFFNYSLTSESSSSNGSQVGFAGEAGLRIGNALLLSDAIAVDTPSGTRVVRLASSALWDDRENLRRITLGDVLTPSRDLSTGVNLGGISISKLFSLDPYFIRFPTQSVTGSVALPSDLEVFVDGQRVRTDRLQPGQFELREILAYGGSRNVQVVLRDPFGRVQQLNYSLYFSDQPLQQGLHEYSYHLGAIRRDYGLRSDRYGPAALTMFHRVGVTPGVTLGWRAEGSRDFLNTGPTATLLLGANGVASLALAASRAGNLAGHATQASYTFESNRWSYTMFVRHDSSDYASLGDPPLITNRRYDASATVSYRTTTYATWSLSQSTATVRPERAFGTVGGLNVSNLSPRRVSTLGYSTPLGAARGTLTASVSHIKDSLGSRNEVTVGLSVPIGRDHNVAASYRNDQRSHSEVLRFTKMQPIGEGVGYDLSVEGAGGATRYTQLRGDVQYNASAALLRADYGRFRAPGLAGDDERFRVTVSGGVVAAGGHLGLSRPVTQSFAIVKVGELPDVPVLVEGIPVGTTNARGTMVVPNLSAYYENTISVAPSSVPLEYALPAPAKRLVPAFRSGALLDFGVSKTQAFSGRIVRTEGATALPVELVDVSLTGQGKTLSLFTGRGGEFYAENLQPGVYAGSTRTAGGGCTFELQVPVSKEMLVELGTIPCKLGR